MIKTVKGKVIAGAIAVGLLSSAGVAFGATDAGQNFKNWFDGQFGKANIAVAEQTAAYMSDKVEGLTTEYNALKTDATNSINAKGEAQAGVASKNVEARSQEHIDAIKAEKAHIETYLSGQFDKMKEFANGLINQAGADALDYMKTDLPEHTGAAGQVAIDKVNTDVKAVTAQAVSDLEETIRVAKQELQAQLDAETDLTIDEIKGLIDEKIKELRSVITQMKNKLVMDQEKLITMTAKSLQLAAEAEMDALVNGMNK
ncbi:hypothetical protein [Sporosarcina sp. FSL K6-3457]|uniref:hypothetical protein n=1 Tax=Sporosarcina sp. FSL K6-3457 TaxID=2978204 RepID=UPI0030F66CFF